MEKEPATEQPEQVYTDEELENISGLCDVLLAIRKRLISEGVSIEELRQKLELGQELE